MFETWDYLKHYDIIMLQETWLEEEKRKGVMGKLSKEFNWKVKMAQRENRKGRAKGGVITGIRKDKLCNVEMEEWEYAIFIKGIKTTEGKCNIINI